MKKFLWYLLFLIGFSIGALIFIAPELNKINVIY